MICVISNRLIIADLDEKIIRWEVWFTTPLGLCKSLHEATELMRTNDIDARMAIAPVCVAVSASTQEIWLR